jgi:hypothetical protein
MADNHDWITNGAVSPPEAEPPEIDDSKGRVETPLTDFNELSRFSSDEGILINPGAVRGGKLL